MNDPLNSKINWTAAITTLLTAIIGILVTAGVIPEQYETDLLQLLIVLSMVVIAIFRTYYTAPKGIDEYGEWLRLSKKYGDNRE